MSNGSIYEGYFIKGQSCGKGRMIYADGEYYEGEWIDDQRISNL